MWQSLRSPKGTDLFGSRRTRLGRAVRKLVREMQSDKVAIAAKLYSAAVNFRDYSRFNQMLICVQDPTATFLRGKRQWLASGHRVRAGAQAIHIIAPVLIEGSQTVQEFAQVNVYDVTDTDGPVLHLPALPRIDDPDDRAPKLYEDCKRWLAASGCVLIEGLPAVNCTAFGATDGLTVWVRPDLDVVSKVATVAHEIAHLKLHFRNRRGVRRIMTDGKEAGTSRNRQELQAELTAFLLLASRGLDATQATAAFLVNWKAETAEVEREIVLAMRTASSVENQIRGRSLPWRYRPSRQGMPNQQRQPGGSFDEATRCDNDAENASPFFGMNRAFLKLECLVH